jgi:hypothetical protein
MRRAAARRARGAAGSPARSSSCRSRCRWSSSWTAALLARSLRNLDRAEIGFDPHDVLTFRLDPTLNGYARTAHARCSTA